MQRGVCRVSLVRISGVRKSYNRSIVGRMSGDREYPVLKGIDFKVEREDFTGIMGRSGCGKTTLLKIIGMIDRPTKGKVCYDETDVRRLKSEELAALRRNRIGFVFQEFNLMNNLSVEENIMLPMVLNHTGYRVMRAEVDRNADFLEISGLLKKYPYELSGGEQQRVAIARALSNNPDVLLADEPTGNLDMASAVNIMEWFRRINLENHKAIVLVTHDPLVASYCKKILFLADGVIEDAYESGGDRSAFYERIYRSMQREAGEKINKKFS
ncbi:MAG: ABC transporter ATP-binding protein [Roseburia sp.]|nr:ABC transporter ATP-binding protein [Roseburia sp.]